MIYGEQSPGAWRRRRACLTCAGLAAPLQPRIGAKPRLSKHRQQNTQGDATDKAGLSVILNMSFIKLFFPGDPQLF